MTKVAAAVAGAAVAFAIPGIGGAILGAIVTGGINYALTPKSKAQDPFIDQARGVQANIVTPVAPVPIVYGQTRYAGSLAFAETNGSNNEFLDLVIVWGEGEIDSVVNLYFNDLEASANFSGLYEAYHHTGSDSQTADATLAGRSSSWTTSHRLRGLAYSYIRLIYDKNQAEKWPGVPVISADIKGRLLYDVRDASTAWKNNPALAIYDYLTDTRYGIGIPAAQINTDMFGTAANDCDTTITTPAGSVAQYTADGLLSPDDAPLDNLRRLLSSCRGYLTYSGGQYGLLIDQSEASSFSFDSTNMRGPVRAVFDSRNLRVNAVRARFYDEDRRYQPDFYVYSDSSDLTADNNVKLEASIDLSFTTNIYRARLIAELVEKESRYGIFAEFEANLEGLRCEVGDVVDVTDDKLSWSGKYFRVMRIDFVSASTVRVSVREYGAIYTAGTIPTAGTVPAVTLADPVNVLEEVASKISNSVAASWLYSFEENGIADWTAVGDATITATGAACVGDQAMHVVGTTATGNETAAKINLPPSLIGAIGRAGRQLRVSFWSKKTGATPAAAVQCLISDGVTDYGWSSHTIATGCAEYGDVHKITTALDVAAPPFLAFKTATTGGEFIIDNVSIFVVPDFIDASTIGTWMGSAAIGTAYLADAAITNAKIGVAEVGTLSIDGNAVTVVGSSYDAAATFGFGEVTLVSGAVVNADGGGATFPVKVTVETQINTAGTTGIGALRLYGGTAGTTLLKTVPVLLTSATAFGPVVFSYVDTPATGATGTYYYKVTAARTTGGSGAGQAADTYLFTESAKR